MGRSCWTWVQRTRATSGSAPIAARRRGSIAAPGSGRRRRCVSATCRFFCGRRDVSALLVWEPIRASFDMETSEAVSAKVYRELGFKPSQAGIGSTSGPVLGGLVLAVDGTQLRLLHDKVPLQQFDDMAGVEPPGWLDVARRQRRCLLIVGETLGLDRFSRGQTQRDAPRWSDGRRGRPGEDQPLWCGRDLSSRSRARRARCSGDSSRAQLSVGVSALVPNQRERSVVYGR